jgi:hypothetical protein
MSEFSSSGHTEDNWKSPRKIAEEIRDYQRKRFEDYMELADIGLISRELAIQALKNECEINPELTLPYTPDFTE